MHPQAVHRTFQIFPWISMRFFEPAFAWRSSTFCVIRVKEGDCFSMTASARCAALGLFVAMISRRQLYHSHTSLGSLLKASGVASSSALNFRHSPSFPLKVGTPLSAETPAPVSTQTEDAFDSRDLILNTFSIIPILLVGRL